MKAFMSSEGSRCRQEREARDTFIPVEALTEASEITEEIEPRRLGQVHTYNGVRALVRATEVSVNGISAAGFIGDAKAALEDGLAMFIMLEVS